jgi:hypothetical protein
LSLIVKPFLGTLKEIGAEFRIDPYSTVSSVVERMKALVKKDEKIRAKVGHLTSIITKSQEQTRPLRPQKGKRAKEFAKNLKIQYIRWREGGAKRWGPERKGSITLFPIPLKICRLAGGFL